MYYSYFSWGPSLKETYSVQIASLELERWTLKVYYVKDSFRLHYTHKILIECKNGMHLQRTNICVYTYVTKSMHTSNKTAREKVFTIKTVCRCRHSLSDQKCVVLYVLDMISCTPPHPHPHPSSIISPSKQLIRVRDFVCTRMCTLLGLQFGQTKNDDLAFGSKYCLVYGVSTVLPLLTILPLKGW
jgi:hypothetical protein